MRGRHDANGIISVAIVALVATAIRLPLVLSARPYDYDDGVYSASVVAMRNGARPFDAVFSSQGPAFLPVLRAFDILGFEQHWSPRLAMVAAGIAIALGVFFIARRLTGSVVAVALAFTAAVSTSIVLASGPLESDGVALAFGTVALAVALRENSGWRSSAGIGILIGLALATKSVLVVPAAAAVVVVLWRRRSRSSTLLTGAAALLTGLAVSLPFGLANVWDQTVVFQMANPRHIVPLQNLALLYRQIWDKDMALVGLAVAAIAVTAWRLGNARANRTRRTTESDDVVIAGWVWFGLSLAVLIFGSDLNTGNLRYMAFLVVPSVVIVATVRIPPRMVFAVLIVMLPLQLIGNIGLLDGHELTRDEVRAVAALQRLPDKATVVGDAQSLTHAAGLASPAWLTDTSYSRIRVEPLEADVEAAVRESGNCAVFIWSGRFQELSPNLAATATALGYTVRTDFGDGKVLLTRPQCLKKRGVTRNHLAIATFRSAPGTVERR